MKRFLQCKLGCHKLPIATGRCTGIARACRLCTFCGAGTVGDDKHLVFECAQLPPLQAKHADLFNDKDHTMHFFFCTAGPSEGVSLCHRLTHIVFH